MEVIPKTIHYCWYGRGPKTKLIKRCIKSWKTYLPDYQIKCWDESNTTLDLPFLKQAYGLKKWAFVADYMRLKVLCEEGGIYLDTDMLVVKSFDSLLNYSCFFGFEDSHHFGTAIIGAMKQHPFIQQCMYYYQSRLDLNFESLSTMTSPKLVTDCFRAYYNYHQPFEGPISFEDISILPEPYFYPLPAQDRYAKNYKSYLVEVSYAMHLWGASWADIPAFKLIRKQQYSKGILTLVKEIFEKKNRSWAYFRKIASSIKQSRTNNNIY